ncbi:MAG: zf-HC2 domain-containing protein [Acidimicrobiales bacterium]|jgi:anti-sigma factor RsiW
MTTGVIRCDAAREALSALTDGETSPIPEGPLRAHVELCVSCRAFASELDELSPRLRIGSVTPAPDAAPGVLAAIRASEPPQWRRALGRVARSDPPPAGRLPQWLSVARWGGPATAIGVAVPALVLGVFTHVHVVPSHVVTPCTHALVAARLHARR